MVRCFGHALLEETVNVVKIPARKKWWMNILKFRIWSCVCIYIQSCSMTNDPLMAQVLIVDNRKKFRPCGNTLREIMDRYNKSGTETNEFDNCNHRSSFPYCLFSLACPLLVATISKTKKWLQTEIKTIWEGFFSKTNTRNVSFGLCVSLNSCKNKVLHFLTNSKAQTIGRH